VQTLATKHTHKKRKYNPKFIAKKLEKLSSNVAKKGIFVVKKTKIGFDVINYIKKEVLVADIPFSNVANNFCDSLNRDGESGVAQIKHHVHMYHKHNNDIVFYKHTIRTSKDTTQVFTAGVRMQDSLGMVKEAKRHLAFY
jgi:hypothetical protein